MHRPICQGLQQPHWQNNRDVHQSHHETEGSLMVHNVLPLDLHQRSRKSIHTCIFQSLQPFMLLNLTG